MIRPSKKKGDPDARVIHEKVCFGFFTGFFRFRLNTGPGSTNHQTCRAE
jgi:hypothetical protein